MKKKTVAQIYASMDGGQLLDELVTFAAMAYSKNNDEHDGVVAIAHAIRDRLAATGIAQKHHGGACPGDAGCRCASVNWSWPRKGL